MANESEPTKEQLDSYYNKLLSKLKKDPQFKLRQELGNMLMRHISTFSDKELDRYNELIKILK